MDIKIKGGGAEKFVEYDPTTGSLVIDQEALDIGDIGRWEVEIEASYTNDLGQEVVYDKKIYFTVESPKVPTYKPEYVATEEEEVYKIDSWLSDDTKVSNQTWAEFKETAMKPFFNETS